MPNTEELLIIYKIIKARPQDWLQEDYLCRDEAARGALELRVENGLLTAAQAGEFCGTAGCFAGHAVLRAGAVPIWEDCDDTSVCETATGWRCYVPDYATELLGLTRDEADLLFYSANTLDDIRNHIINFTGVDPEA